jgi:hypothetical protein
MSEPYYFRKAKAPATGPTFDNSWLQPYQPFAGSPAIMFDTTKLTLADFSEMRTHPQVNASLSLMAFMLHQADWYVECEDKKIATLVEENLHLIWTQLIRGLSTAYWAGYSPMVLEWDNVGSKTFIDKVKDIHPTQASVNWKEVESSYRPRPGDVQAPNMIHPKVKVFDGMNKIGLQYPIPPEHTLWYPVLREHGNYYGRKLLAAAFAPWYFSLLIHLFQNRYMERFGEPTPIGRAPFQEEFQFKDSDGNDLELTGKQVIEQAMMKLRSSGSVVLPSDRDPSASGSGSRGSEYMYDIEYLESQMRGADFERYLSRLDEEISLSIFTPMLLMRSGDRGSLNLGVQHTQTWLWALNALAMDIKEYIDPYICERIKAYNFSEKAPKVEWKIRPLGKDNIETIRAVTTALISGGKAMPDLEQLGMALGMDLKEVKEVIDPAAGNGGGINGQDTRIRQRTDRTVNTPAGVGNPGSGGQLNG